MDMKRFFLYFITIAALALAGCGGNGARMADNGDDNGDDNGMVTCSDGTMAANQAACPADTTAADIVADTAAAATKLTAIGVSADETGTDDQGLGGDAADTGQDYTLAITRDAMKTTVTITNPDMPDTDDSKFSTAMTLPDAGGFAGTMNVRDVTPEDSDGEVVEIAVVRTNLAGPTPTSFVIDDDNMMGLYELNANPETTDGTDHQSLIINTSLEDIDVSMIAAMMFGNPSGKGTIDFIGDDDQTDMVDEADEVVGTFRGASGTYRCTAATCSVTLEDGKVTAATNWIFTPDPKVTVDVENTDYLAYGIWLQRTTDKDGKITYDEVEAFTKAEGVVPTAEMVNVVGSATYTGNSTGVYVKNVTDTSGEIQSATSGLYSALVNLTANFGGGDIGTNKQFRIEGEVTKFDLEKDGMFDWVVKLESTEFATGDRNTFTGEASGDSTSNKGVWRGGFFGVATPTPSTTDNDDFLDAPPHVLGEFNANFTDGAVLGGFGANKD